MSQDEIVGSNSVLLQMQGPSQKHNDIARVGTNPCIKDQIRTHKRVIL